MALKSATDSGGLDATAVQAACAAAITAAGLATAADVTDVAGDVDAALADDFAAIPDATEIQAAAAAALLAKFPDKAKVEVEVSIFDDPKQLIAGVGGQVIRVYGLLITTGVQNGTPMQISLSDSDGASLTGTYGLEIAFGATAWDNGEEPLYTLPTGKGLRADNPSGSAFLCTIFYTQG